MKGQKLFVRPSNEDDRAAIEALRAGASEPPASGSGDLTGLVGRLAGTTVAFLHWTHDGDSMVISELIVVSDLRGLRIGRSLVVEAIRFASGTGSKSIRVAQDCKLAPFFAHVGFVRRDGALIQETR